VVASLPLVPAQPLRLLGAEILVAAAATLVTIVRLQRGYLRGLDPDIRRRAAWLVRTNNCAVSIVALAGLVILLRGDGTGLYILPPGILLSITAAGSNAWVLMIEINR
jgi:hypothetical protein